MKVDAFADVQKLVLLNQAFAADTSRTWVAAGVDQGAMEEVGMLFSQQVERTSKSLEQRQFSASRTHLRVQQVQGIEQLELLYEQLGHPGQKSLVQLVLQARMQLAQQPTLDDLLASTGGDPARAHVVLQYAAAQADAEGRKQEADRARAYQAQLNEAFYEQIQAAHNIARVLCAATDDAGLRQAVRELYYASVVLRQSLASMMQGLLGMFGDADFSSGLDMMRKALADDVASPLSSIPAGKLRTLLLGLQTCGQLSSVLQQCRDLIYRLMPTHPSLEHDAVTLLQRLLGYASSGIAPNEINRLGQELGGDDPTAQLVSLNVLYPVLQRLPQALWPDDKVREEALYFFVRIMNERTRIEGLERAWALQQSAGQ